MSGHADVLSLTGRKGRAVFGHTRTQGPYSQGRVSLFLYGSGQCLPEFVEVTTQLWPERPMAARYSAAGMPARIAASVYIEIRPFDMIDGKSGT
jgi:hypothetical protein